MLDFKETSLCLIIKFTLFLISVVSMHNKNFALSLFKIIWFLKIKKLLDRKYNFGWFGVFCFCINRVITQKNDKNCLKKFCVF